MTARRTVRGIWAAVGAALSFAACGTDSDTTESAAAALQSAQCAAQGFNAAADACFATFDSCKAATGADLDVCRAALKSCLPAPPQGKPKGPGGPGCHGDGGHPKGPGPRGLGPIGPDSAALTNCRDTKEACLVATGADSKACFEAERACVHAAFEVAFSEACTSAANDCAGTNVPADACAKIAERCAKGLKGPHGGADGGVCQP